MSISIVIDLPLLYPEISIDINLKAALLMILFSWKNVQATIKLKIKIFPSRKATEDPSTQQNPWIPSLKSDLMPQSVVQAICHGDGSPGQPCPLL